MAGKPIVIIGVGESADIAADYFTRDGNREVVAYAADREYLEHDRHNGLPAIPLDEIVDRHPPAQFETFVAASSTNLNRVRTELFLRVKRLGYTCASFVSPHAFIWHDVTIGENTFVFEHNVLQYRSRIGDNVVLWSGNHVGHQTQVHDHCFISSHVTLSGFCVVGASTFMGVNACVADNVTIGEDCVVGMGAVVVKDLAPRGVYVGNPARPTGKDSHVAMGVIEAP